VTLINAEYRAIAITPQENCKIEVEFSTGDSSKARPGLSQNGQIFWLV